MAESNGKRPTPPYFAFRTLLNTLERMEESGPPSRIDRTFLSNMSGAGQTQFIAGIRALGLIEGDDGRVTNKLIQLVNDRDSRKKQIGDLLREVYPEAVALGEKNSTTGELQEAFAEAFGVQGDTARKCIGFYLQAAAYAEDIPVSPNFRTPPSTSSGARTGQRRQRRQREQQPENGDGDHAGGSTITNLKLHPAVEGLLSKDMPKDGEAWESVERRDDFLKTFEAVVRFTIPVQEGGAEWEDDE